MKRSLLSGRIVSVATVCFLSAHCFVATADPQSVSACEAETHILDLTVPLPPATQGGGFPGGEGGGPATRAELEARRYPLPLRSTVRLLTPDYLPNAGNITVCLRVENVGPATFDFPVSRESAGSHREGNKNRRSLRLGLRLTWTHPTESAVVLGNVLFSSSTATDSFVRLAPGETIGIRFHESVMDIRPKIPSDATELTLAATINEWTSEDNRYFVSYSGHSETLVSTNAVTLPVGGP